MDAVAESLIAAQKKAEALYAEVVDTGMICAGKLESELSAEIHALARSKFDVRRHWHRRIARCGPNTLLTYDDDAADRRIGDDDVVFLDFGPVFKEWEADFGRTYVLGADPAKQRLVGDIAAAFQRGKDLYRTTPDLTAGQLYDFVAGLAAPAGWEFGASSAGHLIGHFPHERMPSDLERFSIRHGNQQSLRAPDAKGKPRHWILEIHFVDRVREIGGFYEELLTLDTGAGRDGAWPGA
ncbi:MAG: M24 family metallopeptidase [Steroidobacteraceae bacterium]|jgi:Xaa-Pro dipeptidase